MPNFPTSLSRIVANAAETLAAVFSSRRNASMKQYGMNMSVSSTLPPFVPSTVSISVSGSPGFSATNFW